MNIGLSFDDVLLLPRTSLLSRREIVTKSRLTKSLSLEAPLLSAAMDRVTESEMAITLGKLGGLGVLHRNCTIAKQVGWVTKVKKAKLLCAASVGPGDLERALALVKAGCDVLVIDTAHGQNLRLRDFAKALKQKTKAQVIAGNIATKESARALLPYVDALKVGVGPGSICTTRVVSGVGVPQLTAIMDVVSVAKTKKIPVIADGGMRYSGDVVKALAAGAESVMFGSVFAGTDEAPGDIVEIKGQKMKELRGMGSEAAMSTDLSSDRYEQKGMRMKVAEGVEAFVHYKGPVTEVFEQMLGGLVSGMHYIGAKTVADMPKQAQFMQITNAGLNESHPHSLAIYKPEKNYQRLKR